MTARFPSTCCRREPGSVSRNWATSSSVVVVANRTGSEPAALPANARRYLERVQQFIGAPIDMVSTGPDREHTILLRHPYLG